MYLVWAPATPRATHLAELTRMKFPLPAIAAGPLEFFALASFLTMCFGLMAEFS